VVRWGHVPTSPNTNPPYNPPPPPQDVLAFPSHTIYTHPHNPYTHPSTSSSLPPPPVGDLELLVSSYEFTYRGVGERSGGGSM